MSDELFVKLAESVRQGGAILCGKAEPSRAFEITIDNEAVSSISSTSFPRALRGNPEMPLAVNLDARQLHSGTLAPTACSAV